MPTRAFPRDESASPESGSAQILIRGVNWLGDAVMTTPALQRLREARPEARIVLLTPEKLAALWQHHLAVSEIISFSRSDSLLAVARKIRAENFDVGLVFPNSPRSALELWLAGIPRRIGFAAPWRNVFLTQVIERRPGVMKMRKRTTAEIRQLIQTPGARRTTFPISAHHTNDYLALVATLGANPEPAAPRLFIRDEEFPATATALALPELLSPAVHWFGLCPGAEYGPAKCWPRERFVEAAIAIYQRTKCGWIIFGGEKDRETADGMDRSLRNAGVPSVLNLTAKTSLRQLCVLLKLCRLVLTNDTGPMHVAAAVGTPVVVPFGSTSPELTGPGRPGGSNPGIILSDVPCAPCFRRECPIDFRCLNGIGVDAVVRAALERAKKNL
jgi:lipopolysaccharide heptosyltransferase II